MILKDLAGIKAIFLDVDGVLTDGTVQVNEAGEQLRSFSIKDGYALQLAVKQGVYLAVITGGNSQGVLKRLQGLGIQTVYMGVANKLVLLQELLAEHGFNPQETLFMGDDIPDLACMQAVGVAACPQDAVEEIKQVSAYVSPFKGGQGCVRDVLEKILKLQGKWSADGSVKSI